MSQQNDEGEVQALAAKITAKADAALADLEREMIIMKWAPEFRAIMWGAVERAAALRAMEAEEER